MKSRASLLSLFGILVVCAAIYFFGLSDRPADPASPNQPRQHSHQHRSGSGAVAATATPASKKSSLVKRSVAQAPGVGDGNLDDLQAKAKAPFHIRKDGLDGRLRTLVRGQISLEGGGTKADRVSSFVQRYAKSLFGVDPKNLRLEKVEGTDRERFIFAHEIDDISVYGSRLVVGVEGNEVIRLQNDLIPPADRIHSQESMSLKDALDEYFKNEGLEAREVVADQSSRVYMPGSEQFVLAYQAIVTQRAPGQPTESYLVILDARNGQVLKKTLMTVN